MDDKDKLQTEADELAMHSNDGAPESNGAAYDPTNKDNSSTDISTGANQAKTNPGPSTEEGSESNS